MVRVRVSFPRTNSPLPSTDNLHLERFCTFAREPEKRKVGIDARITVDGVAYEVEPDLAGEKVIIGVGFI